MLWTSTIATTMNGDYYATPTQNRSWGFIAYNSNDKTYQVRKCLGEYCSYTNDGKGKWITQDEQHEKTKYQIVGDFE